MTDEQLKRVGVENKEGQSERDAYFYRLYSQLTIEQMALFNSLIFRNPDHVEYYVNYNLGDFDWCYDYIMKNKHLISLDNVPEEEKEMGIYLIESAEKLVGGDVETSTIRIG